VISPRSIVSQPGSRTVRAVTTRHPVSAIMIGA
jgi:hypothetical protein